MIFDAVPKIRALRIDSDLRYDDLLEFVATTYYVINWWYDIDYEYRHLNHMDKDEFIDLDRVGYLVYKGNPDKLRFLDDDEFNERYRVV